MRPAGAGSSGNIYQATSLGPVRTIEIADTWKDLLGDWTYDLVQIRVPLGSRRLLVIASTDDLQNQDVASESEPDCWILDPGVHSFSTNRGPDDPRFYLAIDPTDTDPGAATFVVVKVRAAG